MGAASSVGTARCSRRFSGSTRRLLRPPLASSSSVLRSELGDHSVYCALVRKASSGRDSEAGWLRHSAEHPDLFPPAPPLCCRLTLSQNSFFPSLGQVEGGLRLSCGGQRARQSECKLRFPGGSHSRSSEKRPEVLRCRRRIAGTVPCA